MEVVMEMERKREAYLEPLSEEDERRMNELIEYLFGPAPEAPKKETAEEREELANR